MTIESPVSALLQGGTECLPPGENLVSSPVASSSPAASTNNVTVDEKGVRRTPKRKRHKAWGGKGSKKKSQAKSSPRSTSICQEDEPSKEVSSSTTIGVAGSPLELQDTCTTADVVSPSEKTVDLKKSSKTKCTCDVSKEEAASRKSLRLKLKNGRVDFSNGNNDVRPRYFESLTEIDYNDQNHRIMFMDALGMSPPSKKSPTAEETNAKIAEKAGCICNSSLITKKGKLLTGLQGDAILPPSHWTVQTTEKPGESQDVHGHPLPKSSKLSCSKRLIYLDNNKSKDNDQWGCWVDKVPITDWSAKLKTGSPSCSELRDSLKRLINLGTEIKLITPRM